MVAPDQDTIRQSEVCPLRQPAADSPPWRSSAAGLNCRGTEPRRRRSERGGTAVCRALIAVCFTQQHGAVRVPHEEGIGGFRSTRRNSPASPGRSSGGWRRGGFCPGGSHRAAILSTEIGAGFVDGTSYVEILPPLGFLFCQKSRIS